MTQPGPWPNERIAAGAGRPTRRSSGKSSHALGGVVLIVVGVLFFIDRVGWQWGWDVRFGQFWPVILIALGLGMMFIPRHSEVLVGHDEKGQPVTERRRVTQKGSDGAFVLLVGVLMLLHMNQWLSIGRTWPLFIVALGISVLLGQRRASGKEGR